MEIYLVGGAVRDKLLGVDAPAERDYVVVGASAQEMSALGYRQVGKDFPVFLHPETHEEYALARAERKTAPGYHGFEFSTASEITLHQDLRRRDLTINAIAEDENSKIIDPCRGVADLENRVLRHVSPAFSEDPVRLLRVARFAAQLHDFDFHIAPETEALMREMVASGEVDFLVPERVFKELYKALGFDFPAIFFRTLENCGAYRKIFPMLKAPKNFDFLDNLPTKNPALKLARWLAGEKISAVADFCEHFKTSKKIRELLTMTSKWLNFVRDFAHKDATEILQFLNRTDVQRRPRRFADFLEVMRMQDFETKNITQIIEALREINPRALEKKNIADALHRERLQRIEKWLAKNRR